MKVSEFRSLIREEVKNAIKENRLNNRFPNRKNLVKESYIKDVNLYINDFNKLDPETYNRLDSLMKTSDDYMQSNEKLMNMVDNIMHPDSFNDLPGWIMFYEDLQKLMKSKSPKLYKWATDILAILKTIR